MDFVYYYKTPDNVRHEGEIGAPNRDEAFAALRERGIRPIKVVAKDGTRSNGEVRGVRKRVAATVAVVAALVAAGVVFYFGRGGGEGEVVVETEKGPVTVYTAQPLPRQMIPGDRMRIERPPTNLFANVLEFHLARYAEPGRRPSAGDLPSVDDAELKSQLALAVRITSADFTEHVDLKRIVAGMKREMRAYLAGGGTARGYFDELVKRQKQEVSYREKAESRLAAALEKGGDAKTLKTAYDYWLKANASLKSMGIYELPLPDALSAYQLNLDLDE